VEESTVMSFISFDITDRVATLTLRDPDKRNALNNAMNAEIVEAVDAFEADPGVGALVVTGEGKGFCAGADLNDLLAGNEAGEMREIYRGFLRIADTSLPTVGAINGAAVGAGMNMLLACDVAVAAHDAKLDSRFLAIGLHPGGGHTWRMRRIAGHETLMAMVVFGEVLTGREAAARGVVWDSVEPDALLPRAHELAARAARFPKALVARTKATILSLDEVIDSAGAVEHELEPQLWSMDQPEFRALVTRLRSEISGS
jgi:enoyl-CoA hydratase